MHSLLFVLFVLIINDGNCQFQTWGTVVTVVGNGNWGYSGDSGMATNSMLFQPYGVPNVNR